MNISYFYVIGSFTLLFGIVAALLNYPDNPRRSWFMSGVSISLLSHHPTRLTPFLLIIGAAVLLSIVYKHYFKVDSFNVVPFGIGLGIIKPVAMLAYMGLLTLLYGMIYAMEPKKAGQYVALSDGFAFLMATLLISTAF